jgi:hypothetical protein
MLASALYPVDRAGILGGVRRASGLVQTRFATDRFPTPVTTSRLPNILSLRLGPAAVEPATLRRRQLGEPVGIDHAGRLRDSEASEAACTICVSLSARFGPRPS